MKTKQLFRFKIIFIAGLLVLGAINFIFTRPIWAQTILRPEIVFRSEWGAEDAKDWPPEYAAVKKIIIHHTGAEVDSSFDSKTVVKNLYFGHSILNAWGDIGYNYIISKEGRIFEGRAGGNGAIGAHAMGFNTGSIGIALIGDYNSTMPTEAAMNSLKNLVSWLVWENNLDPRGVSDFRGKKDVPTIAGHNDVNFTNCPGHNLQILLPSLRQDVAEIISRFPAKNFNAAFSSFPTAVIEFGGGEEKELVFQLKNTGNILWTNYQDNALGLKLEGTGDWQNDFFPIEKANLDPNDYSAVKVRITAPFLNSSQDLKFRIASKDNSFLGESQTLRVNVTTPTFKAGLTGMTSSPITSSLSQAAVSLKIKNLGSTSWEKGDAQLVLGEGRIESLLKTNTWVSREIVGQNQTRILSGETLGFDFTFAVPETPKNECFDFKIKNGPKLISGICWQVQKQDLNGSNVKLVSDIKIVKEFSKNIKDYQALYLSQSPFLTVAPGEISNLWVEFKNLGPEIWDASFFRLGTSRPLDRESSFRAQDWLSSNRIAMIPTQVLPGEVARFSFFIRAPETPGNFKEYFSLVADGVGWLPDIGLYWEIAVGTPIDVTGNGKFSIVNGNGKILGEGNAGQIFSVYYSGSRYFVRSDNFAIDTDSYIRFVPQSAAVIMQIPTWEDIQPWYPNPNDNKFRGTIEIRYSPASSALWAIDELPLEDYLKGVAETGDGVPQDFAKALVLAERSYAYYHWSYGGRHPQDFLTLKNSRKGNGDDQVFKGYGYEIRNPGIIKAIEATKGELVVFNNEPVITPYFSQSDGRTRSISEVWGSNQSKYPHLVGVPDPYCQGLPLLGHGVGMSAYGALKMAENGRNYSEILNYYYTGTSIKKVETANILIRVGIYKINI